jgi:DNA-binding NtrC family response regulator
MERVMEDEKLEQTPQPDRAVTVLEVSAYESDHAALQRIFSHSKWKLHITRNCTEAMDFLTRKIIPVVVCDSDLPDGSWKDIMERTAQAANPPAVIVSSRLADDRLWSEVLNLGGYDVLAKPFNASEVFRDVSLAWLQWKNRAERVREAQEKPKTLGGSA